MTVSFATLRLSAALLASALSAGVPALAFAADPAPRTGSGEGLEARIAGLVGRPGGLTSEQVAQRAVQTSFDLEARREQVAAASAQVDAAMVNYFPRLALLGRFTRLSPIPTPSLTAGLPAPLNALNFSFPAFLNNTTFSATLAIPISDYILRIHQGHVSATASEKAASIGEQATRLKVATDARLAYYGWAKARLQVVVAEQALAQAEGHLTDVRRLFEVGNVSKADVLRLESQVANAELLLARARELTQVLAEQLRVAMHDEKRDEYAIGEDVRAELAPLAHAHDLTTLHGEAFDRRLELRSIDESVRAVRQLVKVANAGMYPRLDAVLEANLADPQPRVVPSVDEFRGSFAATVQMTWSPNDLFAARAQARQTQSKAKELLAQKEQLKDGIRMEVAQAMQALREATVAIQTSARGLVAAEEAYRVRRELFRHGRGTVIEVTDAETELTRVRLDAVGARIDLRMARARLQHAAGRDISDTAAPAAKRAAGLQ